MSSGDTDMSHMPLGDDFVLPPSLGAGRGIIPLGDPQLSLGARLSLEETSREEAVAGLSE
eukprot:CAMPEP_0177782538 /NCGR_PEP_ID=MMETSP0491_2-20121128/18550_1 /TAXON_ID=63592 /ORGANISM="Tetraselmis chuii, Strain PLY429" /LENGTH=59 /DNA_ID=CAMNT_0019302903 /DNA_START=24 /DNA_END=200 /DNA_ORIENTATION=-